MSTPELRKILKDFYKAFNKAVRDHEKECARIHNEWIHQPWSYLQQPAPRRPSTNYPPFPKECLGMTCGAKNRAGTPCKLRSIYFKNGWCKFHGGLSTGPKTKRGKRRSAMNGFKPKRQTKPMKTSQNYTF